jgi:aldehyde dehydrogenase (NAD+)
MTQKFKLVIGGEPSDAASGETFDSMDPSTGEPFATVAKAGAEDVDRAVRAARKAFDEGPWPRMRGRDRAQALMKVADLVKQNASTLAELETRDGGHTIRMSKNADIGMVISTFRTFAELAGREDDEEALPRNPGSFNFVRRAPMGVCAAITPWNFPIQMAAWKIAPAIAAGNSVVLKPATFTAITSLEVGRLCAEAGIPEGVVSVLPGTGPGAGEALVEHELVDKVAFTGSTEVGRRIMQLASGTIKKTTLELGGKSPAIVLDDVDMDYAVDGVTWGIFFHGGQVCTAGSRALVQRSIYEDFVAELVKRAEETMVGPAMEMTSDVGPVIANTQLETIERYVEIGNQEGAKLLTGGERPTIEGHEGGFYYRPTIFAAENSMKIAQEEIFGPVLVVIPFEDEDEAVRLANDSIYGLGGAVWSGNPARAIKVAEQLRTGTVWINDYHMINPKYPFGGFKQSGIGREHGRIGFDEYREIQHIHVDLAGQVRERHPWWDISVPKRREPRVPGPDASGPKPAG